MKKHLSAARTSPFYWRDGYEQKINWSGRKKADETRICIKCGEAKPITTFKSSGKCGACRYQEQLMRKRHGGAYSRAGTK